MKLIKSIFIILSLSQAISAADKKPVIITGDRITTRLIGTENNIKIYLTEITGNPRVKYDDKELHATKIIRRGSDGEIMEAVGNVRLIDIKTKSKITSQKAVYNSLKDTAEFTGHPVITTRMDDDDSTVTINAGRIEFDIENDTGFAYGNIFCSSGDATIYSEKAIFDRKAKTAEFLEKCSIKRGEDTYTAEKIVYYTDKKVLVLNGNVRAVTYSEKKDPDTGDTVKTTAIITGDRIENQEKPEKSTVIYGSDSTPAKVERDDAVFTGRRIELKGENQEYATGEDIHIDYRTENAEGSGRHFKSSKDKKRSMLYGDALLVIKDEKTKKESSRIFGDYMEFHEDINELHIFGNIRINCDAGIITGKSAVYNRENKNMMVTGNARIKKKDSVLYSEKIIFNTGTNNTEMTGDIRGYDFK